jgi:hypothetical protein
MNETLINIITYILYIIALIIIVIFVLAIINYTLYTIYSIKEIVVHNTFEDAINYKLKDIYNYRLINYVNIINSDSNYNNNLFENVDKNDIHAIDMKKFTFVNVNTDYKAIVDDYSLSYLDKYKKENGNNIIFELKDINLMKKKDFFTFYNSISFNGDKKDYYYAKDLHFNLNNKRYTIQYDYQKNLILPEFNINKSIYSDVVTTNQSYLSTNIVGKKIIGKDGVIYVYNDYNNDKYLKKSNNNGDIYGYILNGLYLLIPTSLLWSYDKYVTELYIITNNKLYEIILLLLFVILFIIFIAFIGDFYNFIFDNNDYKSENFFVNKIIEKDAYLVIIIVSILAYCILHSIIYFFIFINGTYKKIKGIYDDLIIADEYVRYNVNNNLILQNYYNGSDIIDAFTKIAYGNDINYMKGKYSVIDETNKDIYKTRTDFEKKMLEINYSFSYKKDIYSQNSYSNTFFNKIYNILKIDIDAIVTRLKTQYTEQLTNIVGELITVINIYKTNEKMGFDADNIIKKMTKLFNLTKIIKDSNTDTTADSTTDSIIIFYTEVSNAKNIIDDYIIKRPKVYAETPVYNEFMNNEKSKYIDPIIENIEKINTLSSSVFDNLDLKKYKPKLQKMKETLLFITILYIYFVNNNIDDPYILIKLNKLVFGRVANIGIKEIDDEIDFTLSFKSLLGHNLHKDELIKDLNNINTELFKYIEEYEFKGDILVKLNDDSNPKEDLKKFQEKIYYIEKIDYWGAVYFFNLYLAIELILNAVIILLILMIIKYTNNEMRENVEKYIIIIGSILVLIIDEIKTAILGVV